MKKYYLFKYNFFKLNVLCFLIFIFLYIINNVLFDYNILNFNFDVINWFFILLCYLIYLILHEVFHAIGYVLNGAKFNKITFGIMLEKGILYCLCKQNISKKNILISSMMPCIILGFVTYVIGIIYKFDLLVILSMINIAGSAGDIITFIYILKLKNVEFSEMDDPTKLAIYSSKDISKISHFGLKYIGKVDKIKRDDFRKIDISAASIIIILFLIIISFI